MLEILTAKHKEWVAMANAICGDINLANDLVQDMYIRLYKYVDDPDKIIKNDEVNPFFVYVTLRNLFYDHLKFKKRQVNKNYADAESIWLLSPSAESTAKKQKDDSMEKAYLKILDSIDEEVSTWHWYDQKLFKLYYYTNQSLRNIAEDTKISLTSIYNSCKNYKEILKEKFGEDIEDFFNEDYERI